MPREIVVINKFSGGLSNDSTPSDIGDSEVADVRNMVFRHGNIQGIGKFVSSDISTSINDVYVVNPGYGLITFSADYSSTGGLQATDYFAVAGKTTNDNSKVVNVFESDMTAMLTTDSSSDFKINYVNDTTDFNPAMYYVDGVLRVSDSDFNGDLALTSPAKWIGFIDRQMFADSGGTTWLGWYMQDQVLLYPSWSDGDVAGTIGIAQSSETISAAGKIMIGCKWTTTITDGGGWDLTNKGYAVYATYIYDDNQESFPRYIGDLEVGSSITDQANMNLAFTVKAITGFTNKRLSGVGLYFTENDQNISATPGSVIRYLAGVDFASNGGAYWGYNESFKAYDYVSGAWAVSGSGFASEIPGYSTGPEEFVETYASRTLIEVADTSNAYYKYKTVAVGNNKSYIGNVSFGTYYQNRVYGDAIVVSPVNKHDMMALQNRLEVVPQDGDEIKALEVVGDKLLVFKSQRLYILDISGEFEILEGEYTGLGVDRQTAITKVENGVAWASEAGCYYHNGSDMYDLLSDQSDPTRRKIELEYWRNFLGSVPSAGYDAKNKMLFVADDISSSNPSMLMYDFNNLSWTKLTGKLNSTDPTQKYTNFVTDWDRRLTVFQGNADKNGLVLVWDSTVAHSSTSIYLKTKDYHLDEPGTKKNMYAVYITHKDAFVTGNTGISIKYVKDGTSDVYAMTPAVLPSVSSWTKTRLAPANSTDAINWKSIALVMENSSGVVSSAFIVDDIEIIYRKKGLR